MRFEASLIVEFSTNPLEILKQLTSIIDGTRPITNYEVIGIATYVTDEVREVLEHVAGAFRIIEPNGSEKKPTLITKAIHEARSDCLIMLSARATPAKQWLLKLKAATKSFNSPALISPRSTMPDGNILEGGIFLEDAGRPVWFGLGQQTGIWHTSNGMYRAPVLGGDCLVMTRRTALKLNLPAFDLRNPVEVARLCQVAYQSSIETIVVEDSYIEVSQHQEHIESIQGQNWSGYLDSIFITTAAKELAVRENQILDHIADKNTLGFVEDFKGTEFQSFIKAYLRSPQT